MAAERLLQDIIEVKGTENEEAACEFEHIISSDVTDAICTLLGHPKVCPHGLPIPPGACCAKAQANLESIVLPNKQIAPGFESVTVTLKNDETYAGVLKSETPDQLVINTPLGRESFFDDRSVRRAAMMQEVPCITTLTGAAAAVQAIRGLRQEGLGVRALQDYYAGIAV